MSCSPADLIMLGLATHEPNFTIIREEFKPNKPRPCALCNQMGHELKDCSGTAREKQGEVRTGPEPRPSESGPRPSGSRAPPLWVQGPAPLGPGPRPSGSRTPPLSRSLRLATRLWTFLRVALHEMFIIPQETFGENKQHCWSSAP